MRVVPATETMPALVSNASAITFQPSSNVTIQLRPSINKGMLKYKMISLNPHRIFGVLM